VLLSISITKQQGWGLSHDTGTFGRDGAGSREHSLLEQKAACWAQDFEGWREELLTQALGAEQVGAWELCFPLLALKGWMKELGWWKGS